MECVIGCNAVEAYVRKKGVKGTLYISRSDKRVATVLEKASEKGIRIVRTNRKELDETHPGSQGVVLQLEGPKKEHVRGGEKELLSFLDRLGGENSLIVFLDGITDPGNLGACIRTFHLFDVDCVVIPDRRSAGESEVLGKTSSGAIGWISLFTVVNMARVLKKCKDRGYWAFGADMDGTYLHTLDLGGKVALVLGGEGRGLGKLIRSTCDGLVSIPSQREGPVDSFNVSVAAGILVYEIRRQQGIIS